jgi:hypothetical protein
MFQNTPSVNPKRGDESHVERRADASETTSNVGNSCIVQCYIESAEIQNL